MWLQCRRVLAVSTLASAFVLGLACAHAVESQPPTPQKQVFDYIYVVDTSPSMVGRAEKKTPNIMPKVKAAIGDQIRGTEDGATVVIMPFNEGVKASKEFRLSSDSDREAAIQYVGSLGPGGNGTWIYSSLLDAIGRAEELRKPDERHVQTVLLFTDGLDNEPGKKHSFKSVAKAFDLQRGGGANLWLKYLTLGVKAPQTDQRIISERDPFMEYIPSQTGKVPVLHNVEIRPYLLDFGNMRQVQASKATVRFSYVPAAKGLPYEIEVVADELLGMGVNPVVEPAGGKLAEKSVLTLKLENPQALLDAGDADYQGRLRFTSKSGLYFAPAEIGFRFRIREEAEVTLSPADQQSAQANQGELGRTFRAVAPVSRKWDVRWSLADEGALVTMRVWPSAKNPAGLGAGDAILKTSSGQKGTKITLTPEDEWVSLEITPPANAVKGDYEVSTILTAKRATVNVEDASPTGAPGEQAISTAFSIPRRPLSLLVLLLIGLVVLSVLAVIAFLAFCLVTGQGAGRAWRDLMYMSGIEKPRFGTEQLVVRAPTTEVGRSFSLSGRTSVLIGAQGEFLGETADSIMVEAYWRNHRLGARAVSVEGNTQYRMSGDSFDSPFAEVDLGHGDQLKLGAITVQFESGDISHMG